MSATNARIHTTAGPIEAEVSGSGIPVLILHGSPGGIDAARAMSRFLDKATFKVICLSRPGYLHTPLAAHSSIEAEADLLAALLDALEIPRACVLAWSGGGPAAYRLAARHPRRVACLAAVAALSGTWAAPSTTGLTERLLFGTRLGDGLVRLLAARSPGSVVAAALRGEGSLRGPRLDALVGQVMADAAQRRLVLDVALTVNVAGGRRRGWHNDVANFAAIESLDLEQVQCPVLLVHGDADADVPPAYSESAHARLPHSELVVMPGGTHLSFYAHPEAARVQETTSKFFQHAQG